MEYPMKYIYLDWNVIQNIKHKRNEGNELAELISKIKYKYHFPFSEAHLKDLSHSQNNYILEDLQYLKQLSENYCMSFDKNTEKMIPIKCPLDINFFFSDIVNHSRNEQKQLNQMNIIQNDLLMQDAYAIDLNKITDNNLFKSLIQKNNGILNTKLLNTFFHFLKENIDKPDCYKKFRSNVYNLIAMVNEENTLLNQNPEYLKKLIPFFNFTIDDNITSIKKNFNHTVTAFLSIDNKRDFSLMKKGEKIELIYSLLDFNPLFRDKIDKRNKPNNMLRDLNHLFFASDADYYVTADGAAYKKSKFIAEVLNLKVNVMKVDEILLEFS